MCKFYSAIVLKNGDLLHNEHLTSHEDLIRLFDINDNQVRCENHVKVEYSPDNIYDSANIEKYKLTVDEESTPDWFEKHREYVTTRLKDIVSKRIITSDQKILTGGLYVVKNCKIDKLICAQIIYMQATQVNKMWENSQVNEMWGNSQVNEMRENSQVNVMWGNSQVNEMRGNSQVDVMRQNSQVNEMWGNSQVNEMRGNSQVDVMRQNSQVNEMWGNSQVKTNNSNKKLPNAQ